MSEQPIQLLPVQIEPLIKKLLYYVIPNNKWH